ncbi:hypothetical protein BDN70DRAFT_906753 [Pholiota conissans]|uniref:Uncharacterized protein n=1 Tax=Pholiota conissans TaxID=109636 RepID=A0A9P6D078_9AGAR|nr:hypothetical protein BDN70DRAFT_906753 [Pholiota conissans]
MPSASSSTSPPSRRTHHRRRSSALRISADAMASLPEYVPAAHHDPLDQPPDYPDSAEEADEDTDTEANTLFYVPHLPPPASPLVRPQTASPRRQKRFLPTHKRRPSYQPATEPEPPPDPYLDALLARSVHALEMSNTLLQSSMSTQSSLSTLLAADSPSDTALEARARGLSTRLRDGRAAWADDLEAITRDVEGLFGEERVSASLPVDSSLSLRGPRRRPSLDLRESPVSAASPNWPSETTSRLVLSPQNRANLIAPPPRAITQYVGSTPAEAIQLPSTLGLRSSPSVHPTPNTENRSFYALASSSTTSLLSTTASLPPQLTDRAPEPTTPAYNMLASFVARPPASSSGSNTPSTSFTQSFMRRRGSAGTTASTSTERGAKRRSSSSPSPASSTHRRSRSQTPRAAPPRELTPPVEESSSSDSCVARRTVQTLRKILDEQPPPPPKRLIAQDMRAPVFMPRTPAPVADAGTSTATASVSKLYTKNVHSSSTRALSPPRQSAMKRSAASSRAGTPSTPPQPHSSAPSSGQSTPSKRISFAALPESYAATRPPDPKFKDKAAARKRRRKARAGGSGGLGEEIYESGEGGGGWTAWLGGGLGLSGMGLSGSGMGAAGRHEEKMEDRMTRNWGRMSGGGGFSGGLDEWAV